MAIRRVGDIRFLASTHDKLDRLRKFYRKILRETMSNPGIINQAIRETCLIKYFYHFPFLWSFFQFTMH
jgi:hypothetical protein